MISLLHYHLMAALLATVLLMLLQAFGPRISCHTTSCPRPEPPSAYLLFCGIPVTSQFAQSRAAVTISQLATIAACKL